MISLALRHCQTGAICETILRERMRINDDRAYDDLAASKVEAHTAGSAVDGGPHLPGVRLVID